MAATTWLQPATTRQHDPYRHTGCLEYDRAPTYMCLTPTPLAPQTGPTTCSSGRPCYLLLRQARPYYLRPYHLLLMQALVPALLRQVLLPVPQAGPSTCTSGRP